MTCLAISWCMRAISRASLRLSPICTHCPDLDLDHVEVIRKRPTTRLRARFDTETSDEIATAGGAWNTLILILPAAYPELDCPLADTATLPRLGLWRGRIPHLIPDKGTP